MISRTLAALTVCSITAAAHAGDVTVDTQCANSRGTVMISYSAVWSDGCRPRNETMVCTGTRLELHATAVGEICLTVLTPYTISGRCTGLCDGRYQTVVLIHEDDGSVVETINGPTIDVNCSIADFNNDCLISVQDIFDFLGAYFGNDLRADVNGSGGITVQDIFDYLTAYFSGA